MATVDIESPPLLRTGDNLPRAEFLRLWQMNPGIKKAELVGGIVYMPSPVSISHGVKDSQGGIWLGSYQVATPGTETGLNTTSLLLGDAPQPDHFLRILPECGGSSWIEDDYLTGVPELLAEICYSTAAYDLHQKLDLYQEAKVPEYLTFLLREQEIRWHWLVDGKYQLLTPNADGIWRSRIFPGLWLDGAAFFQGDMRRVLAVLQTGIDSAEHQAFVRKLATP